MKKGLIIFLTLLIVTLVACGTKRTCPNCNKEMPEGIDFCTACGTSLSDKTEHNSKKITTDNSKIEDSDDVSITEAYESNDKTNSTEVENSSKSISSSKTTSSSNQNHKHFYSKKITQPTCTERGYTTYICSCGDTYVSDYVDASHTYKNNVCTRCGAKNQNYNLYQTEYEKLTNDYNNKIANLQNKIAESNKNIENSQKAINNAQGTLATLSPTCPQWFLQQYINNWQAYGNTYAATQAAQNAWAQQYNTQKNQLNNTININNSKIQSEKTNISLYNTAISGETTQYKIDVETLKNKYGM